MSPGIPKPKEPVAKPGVVVGDHVYCHHRGQPVAARVAAVGKHGITIDHAGKHHPVPWDGVLGHKRRAAQEFTVVDEGEDGCIVQDKAGLRQFIGVPPEARSEEMVVKAGTGDRLALFLKADGTPYMGRAGLGKKQVVDKNGVQTTRWVRTTPDAPPAAVGHHVGWQNGDHRGHGQVQSSGKVGVSARDTSGGTHLIRHEHVTHHWASNETPDKSPHDDGMKRPAYAPRKDGEPDKAYAKRAVDTGPDVKDLPEDHSKYFNADGAPVVPLDRLHSTKTDDENKSGGDNGAKRMQAAYHGALSRRDPIVVMPHATQPGHHEVVDGNGTLTSAKRLGWSSLPVKHVSREEGQKMMAADKDRVGGKRERPPLFHEEDLKGLQPSKTYRHTHFKDWDSALALAQKALPEYTGIMDDLASKCGFTKGPAGGPDRMTDEQLENADSYWFMGPIKKEEKSKDKVKNDYKGDWGGLKDLVRATVAVKTVDDVHTMLDNLHAAGVKFAQLPKDNLTSGTKDGYRDVNLVVMLPSGMPAELQVQVKQITKAKSEAHEHYNANITLEKKYKDDAGNDTAQFSDWAPEDQAAFRDHRAKQRKIYGAAWQKVEGSGGYPDPNPEGSAGYEGVLNKSKPGAILFIGKGIGNHDLHGKRRRGLS